MHAPPQPSTYWKFPEIVKLIDDFEELERQESGRCIPEKVEADYQIY